jgi:hypothetical protein
LNSARIWLRHRCETGEKGCPRAAFFCSSVIELKTAALGHAHYRLDKSPGTPLKKSLGAFQSGHSLPEEA